MKTVQSSVESLGSELEAAANFQPLNTENLKNWQNTTRVGQVNAQIDSTELLDYLISDVCLNANNDITSEDPFHCAKSRNIHIGENIPYIVTDVDTYNNNINYQAMASLPILGPQGQLRIVSFKSLRWPFNSEYKFSFDHTRDGYDLVDVYEPGYVSFIRTSDPGCYDQLWSPSSNTYARANAWLLFPWSPSGMFSSGQTNNSNYNTPLSSPRPSHCNGGNSFGITYWNSPGYYMFESGKTMQAIKSFHFASTSLNQTNNALELYYFTKEYGFTRWEAWIPQSRCYNERGSSNLDCHPDWSGNTLMGRCSILNASASGHPAIDFWGGQTWVRVDCRDETNFIALSTPQILLDRVLAQTNGYVDIDTSILQSLPVAFSKDIPRGTTLKAGQTIVAGNVVLQMQTDGNLVVYGPSGAIWASSWLQQYNAVPFRGPTQDLDCAKCYAVFQDDGNLVLYNPDYIDNPYRAYWSSETYGENRKFTLSTSSPYLNITVGGRSVSTVDPRAAIESYYRQYLGRSADNEGMQHFLRLYEGGRSLAAIEQDIKTSPEGLIRNLYLTYFLREPDQGGFQYWYTEYVNGRITLEGIRNTFRSVDECKVDCL